eukprot:CAMPEP_0171899456 /NCGR_PEP_ID=MMETSP0992-20121227/49261_1 /TAXON_ID=483369 /ORGANISM="non described non described, Strain CCMP2098" /LENGTH=220 /DNA_ID=CAMNT_0012527817 /DNA_START=121 /DNA_END=778 /DNA_ORIENTATION=-
MIDGEEAEKGFISAATAESSSSSSASPPSLPPLLPAFTRRLSCSNPAAAVGSSPNPPSSSSNTTTELTTCLSTDPKAVAKCAKGGFSLLLTSLSLRPQHQHRFGSLLPLPLQPLEPHLKPFLFAGFIVVKVVKVRVKTVATVIALLFDHKLLAATTAVAGVYSPHLHRTASTTTATTSTFWLFASAILLVLVFTAATAAAVFIANHANMRVAALLRFLVS